jgi:molecular chaperone GrpE
MKHAKNKQQEPPPEPAAVEEAPAVEEAQPEASPLEAELAQMKDRHVRLMADFDNFRKRQLREREEMVRRANENVMEDVLPFLDTFDLALVNGNADDPFVKGMRMAAEQLATLLAKNGMAPVVAEGAFDANTHEAMTQMPSAEVPEGNIVAVVRRGWTLNGRLLRPTQVVVSAGDK